MFYRYSLATIAIMGAWPQRATLAQEAHAASEIDASEVARHIEVMSSDSMRNRATPSRGLELTAKYVAAQFQSLGLQPYRADLYKEMGRPAHLIWRYPIPPRFDFTRSRVVFNAGGRTVTANFHTAARLFGASAANTPPIQGVVLISGIYDGMQQTRIRAALKGKIALYVVPVGLDSARQHLTAMRVRDNVGSKAVVVLNATDSSAFAAQLHTGRQQPVVDRDVAPWRSQWSIDVRPEAVPGLAALLASAGVDLGRIRADTTFNLRELSGLQITFENHLRDAWSDTATVPNVIGVLEGSDSVLKREHIVFVAHMDNPGLANERPDHDEIGADDNTAGVAGIIELARAFAHPASRPRRSLVFMVASGGVTGLWGSEAFARGVNGRALDGKLIPPLVVGAINLDRIGRGAKDSLRAGGLEALELESPLQWIATAHADLRLSFTDGGSVFTPRSDHFPFAKRGLPTLYFYNEPYEPGGQAHGRSTAIDSEYAARSLRLIYHAGSSVVNADLPPRWSAAGLRQLAAVQKP